MSTHKKALAWLLGLSLLLTACGQGTDSSDVSAQGSSSGLNTKASSESRVVKRPRVDSSMRLALDENGELKIERPTSIDKSTKVNDGTWTIFVYLCGSNLESDFYGATDDMQQMMDAHTGENIKFIVQTGGAYEWHNGLSDAEHFDRIEICKGKATLVDEQPAGDMGDAESLADFLEWGVKEYPAQNMGLIFWNHGGGSISGVCFDEINDQHSLSLSDIDEALLSVNQFMEYNFEFVAFDACLMSTLEMANILASHAYYMYASEETVPGNGLDYTAIGKFIKEHPTADGAQLGKVVADSYYELCVDESGDGDTPTMSVVDLSRMDDVVTSFNAFARDLYNTVDKTDLMDDVIRDALQTESFGGNNAAVGFTNMVDLGGLGDSCSKYSDKAASVRQALHNAVVYSVSGPVHENASGISVYYPIHIDGSSELRTFGQIAVSPYYLAFVDIMAYAAANAGDISAYDDSAVLDSWAGRDYAGSDYWEYYDEDHTTGASPLITFDTEPYVSEDGVYSFTLSEDGLNNTVMVEAYVIEYDKDTGDSVSLGASADIFEDWETGVFSDNFDGYWFSLPDGQNLAVYAWSQGDGADAYVAPIELNGERTNIAFTHDYVNGEITVNGVWDGIDNSGMSERMKQLQPGDRIAPVYSTYNGNTAEDGECTGEIYIYKEGDGLQFALLSDDEYKYGFIIHDMYGDYYATTPVHFTISGSEVYYNED